MRVRVECYAGYRGAETPRRLFLGERSVELAEVVDRWLGQDHRYFKVRGDDGATYLLRHEAGEDRWELVQFTREGVGPTQGPTPEGDA